MTKKEINEIKKKEEKALEFMNYVTENYETIRSYHIKKFDHEFVEDILNDSIIKVFNTITKKGFKGDNKKFFEYLYMAVFHNIKHYHKVNRTYKYKDKLTWEDVTNNELKNWEEQEYLEDEIERRTDEDKLISNIYKFVEDNFTIFEYQIFSFYFRTNLSFASIAKLSGYSLTHCWKVVARIKKALKEKYNVDNII